MCHAYFSMRFEFVIDIFERRRIEIFINSCPEIVSHTFCNHCKAMTYEVALLFSLFAFGLSRKFEVPSDFRKFFTN